MKNNASALNALDKTVLEQATVVQNEVFLQVGLGELVLEAPACAQAVLPGQFVHLEIPELKTQLLRRPFSVYKSDAQAGMLSLLYQAVGVGTQAMTTLNEGDTFSLIGPVGHGWQPRNARTCLLIGGGVGAAPLYLLMRKLIARGAHVDFVLGAARADMLVYAQDFTRCLDKKHLHICTDDGSQGYKGLTTDIARALLRFRKYDYIATCGPEPMQAKVAQLGRDANVRTEVSLERRMACGIGACLGCTVATREGNKRACVDGPVFNAEEVLW